MQDIKNANVTILYKTEYGDQPANTSIMASNPLTHEYLPELVEKNYNFLGWVHINRYGHESSLSERMVVSTEWLVPIDVKANQYYVIFTAKWKNDNKTGISSGEIYDGEYVVIPKVTEQSLPTAEKFMEDDVTIKSIPYFNVSNTAGGSSVYIGSEL